MMQTMEPKGAVATKTLPSSAKKWAKHATDCAAFSASMAAVAGPRFHDFGMRDGDLVVQIR